MPLSPIWMHRPNSRDLNSLHWDKNRRPSLVIFRQSYKLRLTMNGAFATTLWRTLSVTMKDEFDNDTCQFISSPLEPREQIHFWTYIRPQSDITCCIVPRMRYHTTCHQITDWQEGEDLNKTIPVQMCHRRRAEEGCGAFLNYPSLAFKFLQNWKWGSDEHCWGSTRCGNMEFGHRCTYRSLSVGMNVQHVLDIEWLGGFLPCNFQTNLNNP